MLWLAPFGLYWGVVTAALFLQLGTCWASWAECDYSSVIVSFVNLESWLALCKLRLLSGLF